MITEDYVYYETAVLLKEKGFDVPCDSYYTYFESGITLYKGYLPEFSNSNINHNKFNDRTSRPSQSLALKWLREVHKIHIVIYPYGEYSCDNYQFDVYKNNKLVISKDDGYITYEQTVEAALLYVLKNLI